VERAGFGNVGQVVNQTELGRDVALPQPTVHRWLNLLEIRHVTASAPESCVPPPRSTISAQSA
jgi:hypothetical protein